MQTLVNRCKTNNDEKFNASIAERVASVFLQACAEVSTHMFAKPIPVFPIKTGFFTMRQLRFRTGKGLRLLDLSGRHFSEKISSQRSKQTPEVPFH